MKRIKAFALFCTIGVIFSSCAAKGYADTLSCEEISNALISKILPSYDYKVYTQEEISLLLDKDIEYDDCCFMYSSSSDDISEIAVFHSQTPDILFDEISEYAEDARKDNRSFVESYLPSELSKLNDGQARRFGNYVVLAILEKDARDAVFKCVKETLEKN